MELFSGVQIESPTRNGRSTSPASSCTLGREDEETEQDVGVNITNWIDHVDSSQQQQVHGNTAQHGRLTSQRNFQPGDVIEVKNTRLGDHRVDFIQVKHISRNRVSGRKFRGVPFTRTRNMSGRLPKKVDEVCMMLHFRREDGRTPDDFPLLVDVTEELVVRKRNLIFTNATFPEHSVLRRPTRGKRRVRSRLLGQTGNIVCRWKWTIFFLENRSAANFEEESFERIPPAEVKERRYFVPEEILCNRWRGGRVRGGCWTPGQSQDTNAIAIGDKSHHSGPQFRARNQKYTLFDAFSGAGGVSRGAQTAGFRVSHAIDKSPKVWETYSLNFPETELYKGPIDKFMRETHDSSIRVDLLHISPPCQFFSPAHTSPSAHDDDNKFAQFSCSSLVKRLRPRMVTIEQTYGVTRDRHRPYFHTLIGDLTQLGYSVRWRIVALCTWGLPQTRKRLIIIAAGPGEQLPDFPQPTHSENGEGGLRPYTTIRQALGSLPVGDNLHSLTTRSLFQVRKRPLSFDTLLGTIRTGMGDFYYPDGTRHYTMREFACLQGFPNCHKFRGMAKSIKSQIGNAFPPSCVKLLYRHLEKCLLKQDDIGPYHPSADDVVMIDAEVPDTGSSDLDWLDILNNTIDLTEEEELGAQWHINTSTDFMDLT